MLPLLPDPVGHSATRRASYCGSAPRKNETNVSSTKKKRKERKKSRDFRVICVKSSLKLLMPSQSQVEFFIGVRQVSLKSSNLLCSLVTDNL